MSNLPEDRLLNLCATQGPAVIFDDSVSNVTKLSKRHSLRRGNTEPQTKQDWLTVVEFGIMTLEEDSRPH